MDTSNNEAVLTDPVPAHFLPVINPLAGLNAACLLTVAFIEHVNWREVLGGCACGIALPGLCLLWLAANLPAYRKLPRAWVEAIFPTCTTLTIFGLWLILLGVSILVGMTFLIGVIAFAATANYWLSK